MHVQVSTVNYARADITTSSVLAIHLVEPKELIRLAMDAAGIEADDPHASSKLSRALDLGAYSSPGRVRRWREGSSHPNYEATLALLRLARLLD